MFMFLLLSLYSHYYIRDLPLVAALSVYMSEGGRGGDEKHNVIGVQIDTVSEGRNDTTTHGEDTFWMRPSCAAAPHRQKEQVSGLT